MSAFTIVAIVVVIAAVLGFVFTKLGEFAGIGGNGGDDRLWGDHGRLVRTKRLDDTIDLPFLTRLPRCLLFVAAPTVILVVLCLIGVLQWDGLLAGSLDVILVILVAVAVSQDGNGMGRPLGYALVGYILGGLASALVGLVLLPMIVEVSSGMVNGLTMVLGTLGTVLAIAWMPCQRTYAREFADGHVNSLKVSSRSAVRKIYDKLEDRNWIPPEDRIQSPDIADDIRAMKEGR